MALEALLQTLLGALLAQVHNYYGTYLPRIDHFLFFITVPEIGLE